jgi:hypothetical protein
MHPAFALKIGAPTMISVTVHTAYWALTLSKTDLIGVASTSFVRA